MARRSDHTREELAALVIEAASALAAREGLRGIAMRRIAERIGYAPGSIYNAVGDLDDVVLRVNAATLTALAARLEAALAEAGDATPAEHALVLAEAYLDYVAERRLLWGVLFEYHRPPGRALPAWFVAARDRPVQVVLRALAPLFPGSAAARRRAVLTLWAALQGVVSMAIGGTLPSLADRAEPKRVVRLLVGRYVSGTSPDG
jgi:AcrR family transcriptional regulator